MSIGHLLQDFSPISANRPGPSHGPSEEEMETIRLEAFEKGYKAGWEDALKSSEADTKQISGEFARNLQDLSFTYHEAHAQVMQSMHPLIKDIVDTVLPEAVRQTLGLRVTEQLSEMARRNGAQKVEIIASPADKPALQGLLDQDFGFPVEAVEDDTLAEGQVYLRMAQEERQIDMDAVMSGIRQAVDGVLEDTERKLQHG